MGLLDKIFKKKKGEAEVAEEIGTRLESAYNKDPATKKFLEGQGYDPDKKYDAHQLYYFLTLYSVYATKKVGKKRTA